MDVVVSGLAGAEGPVATADGSLLWVETMGGALGVRDPGGRVSRIMVGGGPNGAAFGPDGRCYVLNNGGISAEDIAALREGLPCPSGDRSEGYVQRVDLATGRFETLLDRSDTGPLEAPNDLVFDRHGGFYFTDFGHIKTPGRYPGRVHYVQADGSGLVTLDHGFERPNGIGLSPAGDVLYVAETTTGRLWRLPLAAPGRIAPGSATPLFEDARLMLDSLAVQADGRICIACPSDDVILRVDAQGHGEHIPVGPGGVTNICFGGADLRTAYCTFMYSGEVKAMTWDAAGLPLAF